LTLFAFGPWLGPAPATTGSGQEFFDDIFNCLYIRSCQQLSEEDALTVTWAEITGTLQIEDRLQALEAGALEAAEAH
jgi:hypothetical protein